MYYIITVIFGCIIVNFSIELVSALFDTNSLSLYIYIYIIIGFIVMRIEKIEPPLHKFHHSNDQENPFPQLKKIELSLFFRDLYYASWWPYYLLRKKT